MKKNIFIFDFDGTIADTHKYIVQISNKLSSEFNYNTIEWDELEALKDKTSQEIIKHLKVPVMKIPAILSKAKKEFYKGIGSIKPFDGLIEILHQLNEFGVHMGILSSNNSDNINKFLNNHDIDVFDFIHTTSKVWSKNTSLKKLVQKNGFSLDQILYIGDETRDIVAARKLGVKVAAVTWGYNSYKALEVHNPDFILTDPKQLFDLCTNQF